LPNSWFNNFITGYDKQIEDGGLQGGGLFPTIDIKSGANTFISAGLDPLLMEINSLILLPLLIILPKQ
jgi:hypothetical protein